MRELAGKAEALAQSPRTRNLAAICQAIAVRVREYRGISDISNATGLCAAVRAKFADACQPLEAIYRETAPSGDGQIRTLLAWAEVASGRVEDARKLVQLYPLPLSSGDPVFASLIFPRFLYLRGMVLQNEGKRSKAKQSFELFLKYAGDVPDIFGDEAATRMALGGGECWFCDLRLKGKWVRIRWSEVGPIVGLVSKWVRE